MKVLIFFLIIGTAAYFLFFYEEGHRDIGVYIDEAPIQEDVSDQTPIIIDDYVITPFARFTVKARVLGTERYRLDTESDLSPVDLALGWQEMSKDVVLKQLDISQSFRFYHWKYDDPIPTKRRYIETQSANMHMIPANDAVEDALLDIDKHDVVTIKGYLVRIKAENGSSWNSSTTRNDTGKGACEVVFVEHVEKHELE